MEKRFSHLRKSQRALPWLASLALLAASAPACGGANDNGAATGTNPNRVSSASYVANGRGWGDMGVTAVPVCWVNPNDVAVDVIRAVRDALQSEYEARTEVRFSGFNPCTDADRAGTVVRARFETATTTATSHPGGRSWIGPSSAPLDSEAVATLWFGAPSTWDVSDWVKNATLSAALHEFGHSVGLVHEHERPDAPGCDAAPAQSRSDNMSVMIGPYDAESIMNYCRTDKEPTLSPGDLAGVATLFPKPSGPNGAVPLRRPLVDSLRIITRDGLTGPELLLELTGTSFTASTSATLNDLPVPLTFVSSSDVTIAVPQTTKTSGLLNLVVKNETGSSPPFAFSVSANGT